MSDHITPTTTPSAHTQHLENNLKLWRFAALFLLVCALGMQSGRARILKVQAASTPQSSALPRDGQHDFDFDIGTWHTHIVRSPEPFADPSKTIELNGTVRVRKVWDGRAQLEEIEADGPAGRWEGMSLFLYNPQSHQWSQSFINSKAATLNSPLVGEFTDGRGDLYSSDTFHDKSILVRGEWTVSSPDAHRYEESYSNDGGKHWARAFVADLTREQSPTPFEPVSADPDQHAFDFDLGTWKTHSTRLLHPLTGSHDWAEYDGVSVVKKVWNGRANLAEFKADGPAGHIELLALRWYNSSTHEWNADFATPNVGTLGIPGVGAFKDGRVDFYDVEPFNGRSILVRFSMWTITPDKAQSEQAFSDDGGKTWEVNWINKYTRIS